MADKYECDVCGRNFKSAYTKRLHENKKIKCEPQNNVIDTHNNLLDIQRKYDDIEIRNKNLEKKICTDAQIINDLAARNGELEKAICDSECATKKLEKTITILNKKNIVSDSIIYQFEKGIRGNVIAEHLDEQSVARLAKLDSVIKKRDRDMCGIIGIISFDIEVESVIIKINYECANLIRDQSELKEYISKTISQFLHESVSKQYTPIKYLDVTISSGAVLDNINDYFEKSIFAKAQCIKKYSLFNVLLLSKNVNSFYEYFVSLYEETERALFDSKNQLKTMEKLYLEKAYKTSLICCICFSSPRDMMCLPCKHIVGCKSCMNRLDRCPTCNVVFTSITTVYFS